MFAIAQTKYIRKALLILHVDNYGVDLTKRRLHKGKFRTLLEKPQEIRTLTCQELLRLVRDGTKAEEWQNPVLQAQMEAFYQAKEMPNDHSCTDCNPIGGS